jgi:hypothetical protein
MTYYVWFHNLRIQLCICTEQTSNRDTVDWIQSPLVQQIVEKENINTYIS